MERNKIRLGLSFCVVTVGLGLGAAAGCSSPREESEPTATVQQALLPCDPASPFNPPTAAFTGTTLVDAITFSQNGLRAYLSGKIGASNSDIFVANRPTVDGAFGALTKVEGTGPVSTASSERAPSLSPDGTRLYFARHVNSGTRFNLFYATLNGSGTPTAVTAMGSSFNGSLHDQDPFFHAGTSKLYFAKEPVDGQRDLYVSTFASPNSYSTPTALSTTSYDEYRPVLSPDGLSLYFSSTREGIGGDTGGDIWVVKRASTNVDFSFSTGQITNAFTLNTSRIEFPAGISNDGCTLYSHRS
jgi:Tol biopolymer transport system component